MDKEFPIGKDDFKKLIEGNFYFVDKTLFLKEIMEEGSEVILITRPRRFGKTLNLSMLYYSLSNNHHGEAGNLFEDLEISKEKEFCNAHQHQYPVIFITFKDVKSQNFEDAYEHIEELIKQLYIEHRYLLEGDLLFPEQKATYEALLHKKASLSDLMNSIKLLSEYLEQKFKQPPIILIDEYDTPIQEAYLKEYYEDVKGYYGEMANLMRGLFGSALKGNKSLKKAIVTGITRVAQESLFSGLNNFRIYSMLQEKYGQYFGFTEEEVLKLIKDSQQSLSITPIKEWYNGYQIGQYTLYNPWSIINCLSSKGELKSYWANTASNELIKKLLTNTSDEVKQQFEGLLQGKIVVQPIVENLIFPEIEKISGALWSLLLYAGYLKVLSSELKGARLMAEIAIPNKEVRLVYDGIVEQWFNETIGLSSYDRFMKSLVEGDISKFKDYLSSYLLETSSYFDFKKNASEQIFHIFILGLVVGLRDQYRIESNKESGLGRIDVVFIPKDKKKNGIIIEFKKSDKADHLTEKAHSALNQIKEKQYIEVFKQYGVKRVLTIGMAFYGKIVELVYEIIEI